MIKSIVLDIHKSQSSQVQTVVLRRGELNSTTLNMAIFENGEVVDLTPYEARFMAALPDGKVVIDPCEKVTASMLAYTVPPALLAQAGTIDLAYVALYKDNEWIVSTDCMTFKILRGVDINAETAQDVLGEFVSLKAKLDALIVQADEQTAQQQADWETQMQTQQGAHDAQLAQQQDAHSVQLATQQTEYEAQLAVQREEHEAQLQEHESAFADAEAARKAGESARVLAEEQRVAAEAAREAAVEEALASLENATVTVDSITISEIDEIWTNA